MVSKHFNKVINKDVMALHNEAAKCKDQFGKGLIYLRESYLPKIHLLGMDYHFCFDMMRRLSDTFIKYDLHDIIDNSEIICPTFHKSDFDIMSDRLAISYLTRHTIIAGVIFACHMKEIIDLDNVRITRQILSRKDLFIWGPDLNKLMPCKNNESYHMILKAERIMMVHDKSQKLVPYRGVWEKYLMGANN